MLDLIICSPLLASTLSSFRVLKDSILPVVDHEPVEAVFDLAPQRHADTPIANKFDYNRANWVKFKTILQKLSMDENTVNGLNKKITNEILVAAEESIPVITNAKKSSNLPPFIRSMIKKRREIRARTRETNQATTKTECNKIK